MLLVPLSVAAGALRLDTSLAGADFDGILVGFPGLATMDGVGDLQGNALAVSLQTGVTEQCGALSASELDVDGVQVEHLTKLLGDAAEGAAGSILFSARRVGRVQPDGCSSPSRSAPSRPATSCRR